MLESESVMKYAKIAGLVMLGSENPIERIHERMPSEIEEGGGVILHLERPKMLRAEDILLIHSNHDRVISHLIIASLAESWKCEDSLRVLDTVSRAEEDEGELCDWGDDVQHDFMALELLPLVIQYLGEFLTKVAMRKCSEE